MTVPSRAFAIVLLATAVCQLPAAPTAASLNLCADTLLFEVASPQQIVSVSWLATDPSLSNYPNRARSYPNNRGRIEDLVAYNPDFVFTGANTSAVDKALLKRLGYRVVKLRADDSLEDYQENLRLVGHLLEREETAEGLIQQLQDALADLEPDLTTRTYPQALIFQANGYSPGANSLPVSLLERAGLAYILSADSNWPSGRFFSLEELISQRPQIIVLSSLGLKHPSLADLFLRHRALTALRGTFEYWRPVVAYIEERHFNCGSQFALKAIKAMHQARLSFFSQSKK